MTHLRPLAAAMTAVVGLLSLASFSASAAEPVDPIEPVEVKNPALVKLGKMLFFEPRLSRSGFISCNSCHNLATGGVDNLKTSIGDYWAQGPINSPTVLNSYGQIAQFWTAAPKRSPNRLPVPSPIRLRWARPTNTPSR